MEDSRSDSDLAAESSIASIDKTIRARYSLDLKSNPPTIGSSSSSETASSGTPNPTSKSTRRISLADAKRTHHDDMPLVMVREIARGHSGVYQWRRGAIFVSYPPVEQKELEGMQALINQKCWCHSKEPWRILELFKTSTYAAGPHSYGDITILLGTLAAYCPEQLYLFSDPEDSRTLDRHRNRHAFELPKEPFNLPLKCLYLVHQRNALAKLLPWFRVPADTMAIYIDILESAPRFPEDDRVVELHAVHEWIADLLRRCKTSESFVEVDRVEVKVKQRRRKSDPGASNQQHADRDGNESIPRTRYAVKTRLLHKNGRGSSWSFALETVHAEHGVEFVVKVLDALRGVGHAKKVIMPQLQWTSVDSRMLVALSLALSHEH
ncbi:unnamed protein product [Peniophora sp. CBMAI 1063]|nr:unnamed protein product [Peniophora sp. CBMAI 1063]